MESVATKPCSLDLPPTPRNKAIDSFQIVATESGFDIQIGSSDPGAKRNPAMRAGFEIEKFLEAQGGRNSYRILIDGVVY